MSIKLPRLEVSKKDHDLYVYFTTTKGSKEEGVFKFNKMADLFIVAAVVGFNLDNYEPITEKYRDPPVPWTAFDESHLHLIKSICLMYIKDNPKEASILLDLHKMAKIVQGYANGGFTHLMKQMKATEDIGGNVLSLMAEEFE